MNIYGASFEELRDCLTNLGDELNLDEIEDTNGKGRSIKIHIHTNDPHCVFDACSQFGRLKSVRVEELKQGGK